ncbi:MULTISPECIES: hypothetical protein [Serratia]|uniref:Uncharacterized protein n=1 Tax=Serratia quinivorans TaxID=137545 RepID=A0A379ZYY0_9GAMM|nr:MULTISPECIES: hypothetical protein [Serratia]CAI1889610.1 Uncharacterised protein [Serratia quinivorans]SUI70114.1 Uncharacterised protein [Serratia quinivorans]
MKWFFPAFILICSASGYGKTFQVQIVTQPENPNGDFSAKIVSADFNDPTPNYCYQVTGCSWRGFVNSKSWGVNGKNGYNTADTAYKDKRENIAYMSRTMGEVATRLRNENILEIVMIDYLGHDNGEKGDPTFCVYAYKNRGNQQEGTLASNCADSPPIQTVCELTPDSVVFNWGTVNQSKSGYIELEKSAQVKCSRPSTIRLSVSGMTIPLNGDSSTRAEFNLGDGWTGSVQKSVDTAPAVMPIQARLVGLESQVGTFNGSSILLLEVL